MARESTRHFEDKNKEAFDAKFASSSGRALSNEGGGGDSSLSPMKIYR